LKDTMKRREVAKIFDMDIPATLMPSKKMNLSAMLTGVLAMVRLLGQTVSRDEEGS